MRAIRQPITAPTKYGMTGIKRRSVKIIRCMAGSLLAFEFDAGLSRLVTTLLLANVSSRSHDAITNTRFRVDPNSYEFNAAATGAAVNAGAGKFCLATTARLLVCPTLYLSINSDLFCQAS
jgi:hypothetical protein